jgi:hypothetical protein
VPLFFLLPFPPPLPAPFRFAPPPPPIHTHFSGTGCQRGPRPGRPAESVRQLLALFPQIRSLMPCVCGTASRPTSRKCSPTFSLGYSSGLLMGFRVWPEVFF